MDNINSLLRKEGALRGIMLGAILLVVNIALVYYAAYLAQSPGVFFVVSFVISFIVQIGLAVAFTSNLRKKVGGYWNLKQAITGIFMMLLVTYLISSTGRWLFSKFVDPATVSKANEKTLVIQRKALEATGQPADKIETSINDTKAAVQASQTFDWPHLVQNLLISIILVFAVSAILGALFKREKSVLR